MKRSIIVLSILCSGIIIFTGSFLLYFLLSPDNAVSVFKSDTGGKCIPILSYHCVDNKVWGFKSLFVTAKDFEKQMKYLKENKYTAISFDQIQNASKISKPIIITFDDGYEDNYLYAYPILKRYGLKATVFMISGYINKKWYLKKNEIREMSDLVDFEDHTVDHPRLKKLSLKKVIYEMSKSKRDIEAVTGKKVYCLAYPYGDYDKRVLTAAKKYFKYAVTTKFGYFYESSNSNNYNIKRIDIKINRFIRLVKF